MNALRCAAVLLACWAGAGVAQTVYRCGPDARSYSQQPCPEGRAIEADDARTESQRVQSAAAQRRDAQAAARLERERLAAERAAPSRPVALNAAKPVDAKKGAAPKTKKRGGKPKRPDAATATDFRAVEALPAPPQRRQRGKLADTAGR